MDTNYENLANAIILQAVEDYREALLWLNAHRPLCKEDEEDDEYIQMVSERASIEEFFLGSWFSVLTKLDGKVLLAKLKSEVV
ncbi:MAG: hypothetical protein RR415_11390 [Ruthenibacterium sp.]